MADKIRLTWDVSSYTPDSHNVYRSTSSMDPNALPAALTAVGGTTGSYDDTAITLDTTYYYIVGAVKDGIESLSGQVYMVASDTGVHVHDIFGDGSIVATYQFDGDATDLGGTYNATLGSTSTFDVGKFGQAVVTDGTVGGNVDIAPWNTPDGALSVWIATTTAFDYGVFSFHSISSSTGDAVEVFADNNGTGPTTKYTFPSLAYPTDGTFFHFVVSLSANVPTVYVNGAEVTMASSSGSHGAVFANGIIGSLSDSATYHFAAKYDQLRIFNRALTASEVTNLYNEA